MHPGAKAARTELIELLQTSRIQVPSLKTQRHKHSNIPLLHVWFYGGTGMMDSDHNDPPACQAARPL